MAAFSGYKTTPAQNYGVTSGVGSLPVGYCVQNPSNGRSYRIAGVLGQGGFGITYAAVSLNDGMQLALKEFFPGSLCSRSGSNVRVLGDHAAFQSMLNSFYKEASVLYGLKGLSSVVQIYDYFYANETAYFAMEYVPGGTLLQHLAARGTLSVSGSANQFRRLMRDIEQLHRQGVIHRDISPDNIMLGSDGVFKLVDFGSARAYRGGGKLTVNLKRDFAPIEQYSDRGQGTYTDVYSLAATMYYCYTGRLVPEAAGRESHDTLIPPSSLGVHISRGQERALIRALAVRPERRFQTMSDFEAAFFGGAGSSSATSSSGGILDNISASLDMMKNEPVMPVIAGALFLAALLVAIVL